mgnify:CR=1 FL=1
MHTVGLLYGQLFRKVIQLKCDAKVRYFGFIAQAQKVGEREYVTQWQLAVRARRAISNDGKTVYVSGRVASAVFESERVDDLLF